MTSVEEFLQEIRENKMDLTLTRDAMAMWDAALDNRTVMRAALIEESENIIQLTAKDEWGEHTHCTFDRDARTVTVENFNGQFVVLNQSKKSA